MILYLFNLYHTAFAQTATELAEKTKAIAGIADSTGDGQWILGGRFQLSMNQSYSSNWVGSSDPYIGLSTLNNFYLFYRRSKLSWENVLDMDFGMRYTFGYKKMKYEKTSDKIELNSHLGFKAGGNWYYGLLFNINTQLANGWDPKNDSIRTSTFMTPGYITLSLGINYKRKMWAWYFSPVAGKITGKLNAAFYDKAAFGVDSNRKVHVSVGAYTRLSFAADIHPKVNLNAKLELFYDYKGVYEQLRNVTTNFEMTWRFSITEWLAISFKTALFYDYTIKFNVYDDQKQIINGITTDHLQFQETFGLTLGYKFKIPH